MAMSDVTKKYVHLAIIFSVVSFLLFVGPAGYFIVSAFLCADLVVEKVALTATIAVVLILTAFCAINKWLFRSKVWLVVLVLYFLLNNFLTMILVFAITQILDELIVSPLARHFRHKAGINKEMDKRLTTGG